MGLLRRIFRYLQPLSDDDPGRQDPPIGGNQLSLTFWFGHSKLGLYIGPSGRPEDAEPSPIAVEMLPAPPSDAASAPDQPLPSQAADGEQQSRASGYSVLRQGPTTVSFWDALDPTEREALRAVAFLRTFAAGAMIMHEGERADHVIVILGGRARICVNENGRQRVLVERGVGQLVGERAALQVSVRSATVIAVEMVWALVAQTKDFAVFISTHPRALALIQEQRYDRGTEEPTGYGDDDPAGFHPGPDDGMATCQPGGFTAVHPHPLNGENCTVILTDVVAFGARTRTDRDRLIIRGALSRMTRAAMQDVPSVRTEDRGDGMLMVIPPEVPTAVVMDQLLPGLPGALDRHNGSHDEPARFQLRLAINVGPVVSDTEGVSGEAIIVAARLVDAPDFKDALVGSTANLGVIASPFVYETVIRHGQDEGYSEVPVEVKESRTTAWMKFFHAPPPISVGHRSAA